MRARELIEIKCPFYGRSSEYVIICEGVIPGTMDSIRFKKSKDRTTQIKTFCSGCYEKCERFAPIDSKYSEDGEGDG